MSRLADYFAVVGYSHEKDHNNVCCGKILQRFPEKDWSDCPFMSGLPLFCQPMGWALSRYQKQPSFYVAVLTDMDGERHYCAVFTFYEMIAPPLSKPDDEEDDPDRNNMHQSALFAPKSLVLVSRHDYFESFRNCLSVIYTVYLDNMTVKIESLVGNMLGCIHVPPAGGPQVRFSLGAGDRQVLQPPVSASLPVSNTSVALLFEQLGINNTLTVFSAALTDHKILFYSESCSRLCEASRALASLHYPLKYTYVFIPVLPASLLEVLSSPTPFIAGVHASLQENIADLLDVITVDLDGGSVHVPECISVPSITDDILVRVKQALLMILNPSLQYADDAFSPVPRMPSPLVLRDKELRAVFIRMFAELFCGYRSSLAVIRIHPSPFITFHKSHFLGQRDMVEDSFLGRLLDGMAFNAFVAERGPPYRVCDIFDEVSATIQDQLQEEVHDPQRLMENIRELAHHLYMNECTQQQPFVPLVPEPADGTSTRTNQPPFPMLDGTAVQEVINEGLNNNSSKRLGSSRPQKMRIVPVSGSQGSWSRQRTVENHTRRLEVVKNCVNLIFDHKITEAAKIFPAVLRALKSKVVRLALTQELGEQVRSNRAMLENQQFDLVVRLLNCALMNDSSLDENGVAAAILPLATAFYRKLCPGVIQFAYTLIQEHAVWENLQFWEQSFYQDVQSQIHQLYLPMYEEHMLLMSKSTDSSEDFNDNMGCDTSATLRPKKIGPLEIAAEQLRIWASVSPAEQQEMVHNEESTVYSQAIHYAYRMVYLRVPVDVSRSFKNMSMEENSSIVTPSVAESDSFDAESGFDETEHADIAAVVTKFVSRFVDKVCSEASVSDGHFKSLQQLIPGIVAMHIETLEGVNRESKQLPPVQKPRILQPLLLPGEEIVMEGLRAYLLPDGREEGAGGNIGGPSLLPSEGAVFLTSYRIIFRGMPCDPFACENTVMRSFPVSSLTKEKKISLQNYLPQGHQVFQEGLQLRSTVFQLMKIAFDGEVSPDNIETFWKLVNRVRHPATVFQTFAFSGHTTHPTTQMRQKSKENISLREFAKQKLLKTARKAGLKKHSKTKMRHSIAGPLSAHHHDGEQSPHSSDSETDSASNVHYGDLTVINESEHTPAYSNDPKNIERLMERHAYQDYQRLGLGSVAMSDQRGSSSDQFRVSTINANYLLSKSYPGLLVVPQAVSDDSIRKFCRCNRHARFPVITWRHPKTRALLLRASSFHARSLGTMLRHSPAASGCSTGDSSSTLELGKYLSLLISATPSSSGDPVTSLDLLIKARLTGESLGQLTNSESRTFMSQGHSIDKRMSSTSPRSISQGRNHEPCKYCGVFVS
ncbi:hypothetical protein BsWGS_19305 [Bradybaena similaris]